jgi:hypothetical protein
MVTKPQGPGSFQRKEKKMVGRENLRRFQKPDSQRMGLVAPWRDQHAVSMTFAKVFALCVLLIMLPKGAGPVIGADRVGLGRGGEDVSVIVQESSDSRVVVRSEIRAFTKEKVEIQGNTYYRIGCGQREGILLNAGGPALPRICRSIIIPDDAEMQINVLLAEYDDFPEIPVVPSKGNLPRSVDPDDVPFAFGSVYGLDQWYPDQVAAIREPFILRDFRGTVIELNAFQYHPRLRTLRVYKSLTVEVVAVGSGEKNVLRRQERFTHAVPAFHTIYKRRFINYGSVMSRHTPLLETGDMLIITYDDFHDAMLRFVEWKRQKGIPTSIVDISTIGNDSTAIKNYIRDAYNVNPDLAWVLLVGDAEQVATPMAWWFIDGRWWWAATDPSYAKVDGDDYYPDVFVGRFSAQTVADVETQVSRTISYEKHPQPSGYWYHKAMGIASDEGPGHHCEFDYEHMDIIRQDLLASTYTEVDQLYQPWLPLEISQPLNGEGRGIIDYAGHGTTVSWIYETQIPHVFEQYLNLHVNALTNANELPFIFSVACLNGNFTAPDTVCFAETWLRARNLSGDPTGAIATYMSSIPQFWNPPMDAQDEAIDLLCTGVNTTFAGVSYNGACRMIDINGARGDTMFCTWHVFGDPSVQLRTDRPTAMAVAHEDEIRSNQSSFHVSTAGGEGALCALYGNGVLYGCAYTSSSGEATIHIEPPPPAGQYLKLTVTQFNVLTYVTDIHVISSGPDVWPPMISFTPLSNTMDEAGPYQLSATIKDNSGVADATLYHSDDGIVFSSEVMECFGGDEWTGSFGGYPADTEVHYYIEAVDASENSNVAVSDTFTFWVVPSDMCWYVGRCKDAMYMDWCPEWTSPGQYTSCRTKGVHDGEFVDSGVWFIMDIKCIVYDIPPTLPAVYYKGLLVSYDQSHCYPIDSFSIDDSWSDNHGLAYDNRDGSFWYTVSDDTHLHHIDGNGDLIGAFNVGYEHITGLAFDAENDHLWCIVNGDPDMLLECDVSAGGCTVIQGPYPVPWYSPTTYGAAGLDYHEGLNLLVAVNQADASVELFRDLDPDSAGGIAWNNSCYLTDNKPPAPWGVAVSVDEMILLVADNSPDGPNPLDKYRAACFNTGDANADAVIDVSDAVFLLNYLFEGGPPPDPFQAGDVNCSGIVDLGDPLYLLNYLFRYGPPPCCYLPE